MKKNVVKINENAVRQIITESVKRVLKEYQDGGLFDPYNEDPEVRKHQIDMAYAEKAEQDSGLDYASYMAKKSDQDLEKSAYEKGRAQLEPRGGLNLGGVARDQNWNTYDTGGRFGMSAQGDNPYMRHQAQRAGSTLAQSVKQGMNDFSGVGLDESRLKSIVRESVGKVLKETAIRGIDDNGKPTHYATQDDENEDYAMEQCARAALEFIQHKESQFSQEWFNEFCDKCSHDGLFAFMDKRQMKECWIQGNKAAHSCVFNGNGVQVGRIPTHYEGGWQ